MRKIELWKIFLAKCYFPRLFSFLNQTLYTKISDKKDLILIQITVYEYIEYIISADILHTTKMTLFCIPHIA